MYRFGFDIGGTKTEAIVLGEDNTILFRERVSTPAGDYDVILGTVADLFEAARTAASPEALTIGCAIPGAPEVASGKVKNANTTALIGRPIGADLSARLGHPVAVANDANCFALSEARDGAATGTRTVFGAILGTGVGGGLVMDGRVVEGPNRLAGEWGHNPFPFRDRPAKGRECYCGRIDCIETIVSGPALARDYVEAGGGEATAIEIWARADEGEATARMVTESHVERLAMALATIVNILDPDVIVLGGGLSNVDRLYAELPAAIAAHAFHASAESAPIAVRVVRNEWGDSSGVRGAAAGNVGRRIGGARRRLAPQTIGSTRYQIKPSLHALQSLVDGIDPARERRLPRFESAKPLLTSRMSTESLSSSSIRRRWRKIGDPGSSTIVKLTVAVAS